MLVDQKAYCLDKLSSSAMFDKTFVFLENAHRWSSFLWFARSQLAKIVVSWLEVLSTIRSTAI